MSLITIIAIIAIATLETIALINGINGALLGFAITAIAGLGGYQIGRYRAVKEIRKRTQSKKK